MSSLTSYQVVAAISTLVVLAVLNFIGGLWQDIEFVRDIT
jgi:ABC-2 type transport system permease protein